MLHKKTVKTSNLISELNGTVRASGSTGNGSSGGPTWTDSSATFETDDVAIGDVVYITGEGEFTVLAIDSETQITLSGNLGDDYADVNYKITYDRLAAWSDIVHLSKVSPDRWLILYESDDFNL